MVPDETRDSLINWLKKKGTVFHMNADIKEISSTGVRFIIEQGAEQISSADTIIPALRLNPNSELYQLLGNEIQELYTIGDCREPGLIPDAVGGGADIGYKL